MRRHVVAHPGCGVCAPKQFSVLLAERHANHFERPPIQAWAVYDVSEARAAHILWRHDYCSSHRSKIGGTHDAVPQVPQIGGEVRQVLGLEARLKEM
jgi:hypothetical protein